MLTMIESNFTLAIIAYNHYMLQSGHREKTKVIFI